MNRIYLMLASLFTVLTTNYTQSLSPQVLASAGGYFSGSNGAISWTLGEPVVETFSNGNVLTQGFHQPVLLVTEIDQEISQPDFISVKLFPNPVSQQLSIELSEAPEEDIQVMLFDMNGRMVNEEMLNAGIVQQSVDLSAFPNGNYVLKLRGNKVTGTYQIQKME